MPLLLHIEASPRGDASRSTQAARVFIEALRADEPSPTVDHLDLWQAHLPPFDGVALSAKYASLSGRAHEDREVTAWREIETMVTRLDRAEHILNTPPSAAVGE